MKIALYVPSFLPTIGGRELVVHHLAKAYMELGHQVRVVGPAGWWRHRHIKFDYPLHRWPTARGLLREQIALSQLYLYTSLLGCDIIHAHATYPSGYIGIKLKKYKNIPLIITPHGVDIHVVPTVGYGMRLDPKMDKKIRVAVQKADLLTAISGSVEQSLISAGAAKDKIIQIPNGVDVGRFRKSVLSKEEVCNKLNFPPDAKIIITIGRYEPRKGQDVLIRSMPEILEKEKSARLVIIGQKTEVLNGLISGLGLDDKIRLAGTLTPPNVMKINNVQSSASNEPDWLVEFCKHSYVYVSASIDEGAEGLSLALLEGMAAGLPVVATDISGNKDVVIEGHNGYIVPPGGAERLASALINMLKNESMRASMAQNAINDVMCYGWTAVAKQYLNSYDNVREKFSAQ